MAVNGGLKFSELIRKLKEIDNELMFSFQEFSDGESKNFNYVVLGFGYNDANEYWLTLDFNRSKVEYEKSEDEDYTIEELIIIKKIKDLVEKYFNVIKSVFRG